LRSGALQSRGRTTLESEPVIPGRASFTREPGIHNHDRRLWIPGLRPKKRASRNDGMCVWYGPGSAVHRQKALHRVRETRETRVHLI